MAAVEQSKQHMLRRRHSAVCLEHGVKLFVSLQKSHEVQSSLIQIHEAAL